MTLSMEEIIQRVKKLPTINTVAFKVIQLCSDPEVPIPKLVKVISGDQSLSSQVLRVANSSFFNYPREIYSLDRAIVILGFNLLKDITVSLSIFSLYKSFELEINYDFKNLWRHSLFTGFAMKTLSESFDPEHKEILYIAGLLHDIGKLVLLYVLGEDYYFLLEKSEKEKKKLLELERKYLEFDHSEIGAKLLENWKLPEVICSLVKYHHIPDQCEHEDEIASWIRLVYLGNILAHLLKRDKVDIKTHQIFDYSMNKYYSFTEAEIIKLMENIRKDIQEQENYIKLFEIGTL